MEKQWTVYILECGDGTLYTGITDDLERRLRAHAGGKGAKYTRGRAPLQLRYREAVPDKSAALKREHAIKGLSRREKLLLIETHSLLAKCGEMVYTDNKRRKISLPETRGEMAMKKERTLVVLAAGIGSRFKGGVKQLQQVGPGGEIIMEYSIHDALEAGFNRVIFIIRHDIEALFNELIGDRVRAACARRGVEVLCAYQEKEELPDGFTCPDERVKPWGTGHALLSCKGMLHGGFIVINADDYYGADAYRKACAFLDTLEEQSEGTYGLIGFRLGNTLSDHGGVTRGLCRTEDGWLTHIQETKQILKTASGARADIGGIPTDLSPDISVSMNMWGFTPDVLEKLEDRFIEFLSEGGLTMPKSEFLIPSEMGVLVQRGTVRIRVLPTTSQWFGMTFAEDMPGVREAFARMTAEGLYPSPLFQ